MLTLNLSNYNKIKQNKRLKTITNKCEHFVTFQFYS